MTTKKKNVKIKPEGIKMDSFVLNRRRALNSMYRDNCFIYVRECADPQIMPHTHDFLEIVYITQGAGVHYIGNEIYNVTPGDVFIVSTNATHSFVSDDATKPLMHYDCLLLLDEAADQVDFSLFSDIATDLFYNVLFPQDVNRAPYIYLKDTDRSLKRILDAMADETRKPQDDSSNLLFGCAIELLVLLRRLYNQQFGKNETIQKRREGILMAIHYLEKNYTRKISLNELSRIALFSPNYFCTLFKETTGLNVTEYIQQIRNKEAIHLLLSTDLTVRDICEQVGYSDERLFRRVFSKSIGCTPSEYRKKFKH